MLFLYPVYGRYTRITNEIEDIHTVICWICIHDHDDMVYNNERYITTSKGQYAHSLMTLYAHADQQTCGVHNAVKLTNASNQCMIY